MSYKLTPGLRENNFSERHAVVLRHPRSCLWNIKMLARDSHVRFILIVLQSFDHAMTVIV